MHGTTVEKSGYLLLCSHRMEVLLPVIHPIVDEGVHHCVRHCEPIEGQVHVLHIAAFRYRVVVIRVYKVAMIGEPAECEDGHHNDKHLHHLQENTNHHHLIILYSFMQNISNY